MWDDCIIWTKGRSMGYGTLMRDGRKIRAHQAAWLDAGRELAPGTNLHHRCGEKLCVNVTHLEQVSVADHARMHIASKPVCPKCNGERRYMEKRREYRCRACDNVKRTARRRAARMMKGAVA